MLMMQEVYYRVHSMLVMQQVYYRVQFYDDDVTSIF